MFVLSFIALNCILAFSMSDHTICMHKKHEASFFIFDRSPGALTISVSVGNKMSKEWLTDLAEGNDQKAVTTSPPEEQQTLDRPLTMRQDMLSKPLVKK